MRSVHVISLVTGLGSSIPLFGGIWTAWARKLEKRFKAKYPDESDVLIMRASSDGNGEDKIFKAIFQLYKQGLLGKVCCVGHSNGVRDTLLEIETLYPHKVQFDYVAAIDQALLDSFFSSEAWGNILHLDEFHAKLEYVNIHSTFKKEKRVHQLYEIKKGHTAAASDPFVQDRIFQMVCEVIDKGLEE